MRATTLTDMPNTAAVAELDWWPEFGPLLDAAVDCLPEPQRAVVVLCGLEGWNVVEAARQLNCSPAQVQGWLLLGLSLLRQQLLRRGSVPLSIQALFRMLTREAVLGVVPERLVQAAVQAAHGQARSL